MDNGSKADGTAWNSSGTGNRRVVLEDLPDPMSFARAVNLGIKRSRYAIV